MQNVFIGKQTWIPHDKQTILGKQTHGQHMKSIEYQF